MPRKSKVVISTDRQVAAAKGPSDSRVCSEYRIAGTPNLVLRVTRSGHRSWTYWVKRPKTGRYQKLNLGPYPAVSLARARDEAVRARLAIVDGIDPFDLRDPDRGIMPFRDLGETYVVRYAKPKKRSWAEDERKLIRDVYPVLAHSIRENEEWNLGRGRSAVLTAVGSGTTGTRWRLKRRARATRAASIMGHVS